MTFLVVMSLIIIVTIIALVLVMFNKKEEKTPLSSADLVDMIKDSTLGIVNAGDLSSVLLEHRKKAINDYVCIFSGINHKGFISAIFTKKNKFWYAEYASSTSTLPLKSTELIFSDIGNNEIMVVPKSIDMSVKIITKLINGELKPLADEMVLNNQITDEITGFKFEDKPKKQVKNKSKKVKNKTPESVPTPTPNVIADKKPKETKKKVKPVSKKKDVQSDEVIFIGGKKRSTNIRKILKSKDGKLFFVEFKKGAKQPFVRVEFLYNSSIDSPSSVIIIDNKKFNVKRKTIWDMMKKK